MVLLNVIAFGQKQNKESYDYQFVTYQDGSYINCRENIFVDTSGFLWIASHSGLIQYDGLILTNYSKSSYRAPLQLPDIQLFNQTSDGKLILVSSENIISLFDTSTKSIVAQTQPEPEHLEIIGNTFSTEHTGSILLEDHLVTDNNGGYYTVLKSDMSYVYHGFYSADGKCLEFKKSFDIGRITSIEFSKEELFLTTDNQVRRYDPSFNLIKVDTIESIKISGTAFVTKDNNDNIYVYENCLDRNCNIFKFDRKKDTYVSVDLPTDLDLNEILKIRIENGIFWFFGVNKLIYYDPKDQSFGNIFHSISKAFENFDSPPLISHYTSIKSKNNLSWLTSGYGLVQIDSRNKSYNVFLKSDPDLCNGFCSMRGIDEDQNGNLWLASYSGLIKKTSTGEYSKIETLSSQLDNGIYSLVVNDPHVLVNDVLYNIKTTEFEIIIPEKQNGHITNLSLSNNEYLLSSCYNDGNQIYLYRYNSKTKKRTKIALPSKFQNSGQITDMLLSDSGNEVYMALSTGGTIKMDLDTEIFYSMIPTKFLNENRNTHYCLYEKDQYLYIGTSVGLIELESESNTLKQYAYPIYSSNQTIEDRSFFSILEENDSTLWVGTNSGVLSFNRNSKEFIQYTQLGKLGKEEFNRQSSYKLKSGQLLFGSVNGVYELMPDKIYDFEDEEVQSLNLISIQHFDGQTQKLHTDYTFENDRKITFQHNDKMLNFKVALPEYRTQQTVFYSYFLDGFHNEWSVPAPQNEILISNLDPGNYTLQLKAGNDAKLLDSKQIKIPIEITEPWYVSFWFRSLLVFLAVAFIYTIFKIRYLQLLKYEQLRSDISRNLHDDVGTILTGIAMQSEMMEKFADNDIKKMAGSIAMRSREAMSSMRDTVWAIDSRKDSILDLKDRILDYVMDTLYPKDISYTLESNIKNSETKITPDIRQTVYLIAKETINNIVKHSDTPKVDIELFVYKKVLSLNIQDYGSYRKIKLTGQGLMNMKNRAQSLNGEYKFHYNNGFSTVVKIPLK